ncbi:ATP-dependent RNA helicase DDX58 [Mizuhopecten yessoensis]|uniref:RNA helicase n=2 Tax=Mizuhopecten yessoensis TaxID=6573 RepID=A0A210Q2B5_MIZYE|nr:ATP-dependent RNA helicase DDX58 [Mizuhopecten yessoensis]
MATNTNDDEHLQEKIDVYRLVLMECVIPTELLPSLTDVLSGPDASTIKNLTRQSSDRAGTEHLLNVLVEKTEIRGRWRMLVNALKQHGYGTLSMILEGKMDLIDRDRNKRIIEIFMLPLQKIMKPLDILPSLIQKGVLSREDDENIEAEHRNHGMLAASALLLDRIYRKKSNWYDMFLQSLAENDFGHLAEKIDPDFMKKWTIRNEEVIYQRGEPPGSSTMENYQSDDGEAMTDLKGLNLSPNHQRDHTHDTNDTKKEENLNSTAKDSAGEEALTKLKQVQQTARQPTEHDELSGTCAESSPMASNDQSEPVASVPPSIAVQDSSETIGSDLSLYRYQEELAKPGLEGHNSIVIAPTNSGKTHVAIRIMQHHLRRGQGKVIFLVPTSALATQQRDRCHELLKCPVKVMTGESQAREKYIDMSVHLKNHDVIVATPQILVNCLLAKEDVTLQTFSLIVFDECHRTYEDTPYNAVMRIYWDEKFTSAYVRLPQILGMTASLGSGQANSQSSANTWVKNIMANMDSQKLVTVKENIKELEENINNTDTEIIETKERRNKSFGNLVNDMMATIEGTINRLEGELKRPPTLRSGAQYTQWCSTLRKQVTSLSTVDNDLHRSLKIYADYLEVYHRALLIYQDARVSDAVRYLKEELDEMYFEETAVEADREMYGLFQEKQQLMENHDDGDQENPKLHEVQVRICTLFRDDPDSRAIIYVKTIELARSMEAWMNECPELQSLKAVRFVGAHAKVGIGGITKMEQDTILKAFRNGDHKVVIGTSVLEEGLDVPRCNLVILYDHVTNEIQRVQTRGRIRRDNSHFVLIVSESGQAAQKELVNERREDMSSEAIRLVQDEISRDPQAFYEKQQDQQREEKRKRDAVVLDEQKQLENNPVYEVKCNHCRGLLFLSSDLRKIKVHHTVVARGMKDTLSPGPRGKPSFVDRDMEHGIAELYCKTCQIFIGSVNKSMSLFFPMPRIDQITFSRDDVYKTCKKWKDVKKLFGIKTFCPIEDMRFILALPAEERDFYTS